MAEERIVCPKCKRASGDDWSHCGGSCPMPCSPHYAGAGAVPDTRALMKATPISGWGRQSIGLSTTSSERFDPVKHQNEGAPAGWRMSLKADGGTYRGFIAAGWTEAQMREHGYLEAVPPAEGQAPITARAGWVFVTNTVNGTITANEPDGTRHSVQRGDMNTVAGRDMLNAMVRDLKGFNPIGPDSNWQVEVRGTGWKLPVAGVLPGLISVNAPDGHVRDYPPLTHDEIVALACMQGGAPWQDHLIGGLVELFAIYDRLRAQGKRPVDPADMTDAEQAAHWGFADSGAEIEARLKRDAEHLNCKACGGSGHADDMKPIDMVLHCPKCRAQHIDAPDLSPPENLPALSASGTEPARWENPPHRTHLCHACRTLWRPANVATNGVAALPPTSPAAVAAKGAKPC